LCETCSGRNADMDYLRILGRCAETMETQVARALESLRAHGLVPRFNTVVEFLPGDKASVPQLKPLHVDLEVFDTLLTSRKGAVHE
jgi:hypothetical protein